MDNFLMMCMVLHVICAPPKMTDPPAPYEMKTFEECESFGGTPQVNEKAPRGWECKFDEKRRR